MFKKLNIHIAIKIFSYFQMLILFENDEISLSIGCFFTKEKYNKEKYGEYKPVEETGRKGISQCSYNLKLADIFGKYGYKCKKVYSLYRTVKIVFGRSDERNFENFDEDLQFLQKMIKHNTNYIIEYITSVDVEIRIETIQKLQEMEFSKRKKNNRHFIVHHKKIRSYK